jgi:hypothetical protein
MLTPFEYGLYVKLGQFSIFVVRIMEYLGYDFGGQRLYSDALKEHLNLEMEILQPQMFNAGQL